MIFLLFIITLILYVLLSWINLIRDSKRIKVPGNFIWPILGNGHEFLVDSEEFINVLRRLSEKYNDAARFYLLSARYIVLSHPKYIEPLASSSELITKGKSYSYLKDWLGFGLISSTGHRWRTHRKFLTPAFHFNILQNFMPVFTKNEIILRKNLQALADGRPISLFPIIALHALDNVAESIMGVSVHAQDNAESEYVKAIEVLSSIISIKIRNLIVANDLIFRLLPLKSKQDKALKVLHGQTRKVIEARKKELAANNKTSLGNESELGIRNKHAFLDLLLLAEINGQRIDDETIREEVDTFMFAGHDTTTSGITFCLYNISRHKDVQQKLFDEQKEILGDLDREPTFNDIRQMKYLDLVIKESLRLHPSVPLIERVITHDVDLGGLFVTKGTNAIINILQMHRNPKVFEDPLEFKPERFDKGNIGAESAFSWMPFSAGPRNCIGQKYALLEMKVTLSGIIRHFELLPSGIEPVLCGDLILRSKNGVHVKMLPRNKTFG